MHPVSPRAFEFTVAIAAALAALAGAPTARAQQPAATSGGLEEVIVTAQKREQNLQEIGISLSAVSGSDLTELGVVNATDITKSMPAVVLTQPNGPSSFSLAIRGVVQNDFADHQESPAAIYVDDVYVSQMIGLAFSTFDIDRVEVLRGPQGTLFGRNATGSLAHFVPPNENFYNTCAGCNASGLPNSGPFVIRDSISGFTRLKGGGLTAKYTRPFGNIALTVVGDFTSLRKDYQEDSDASPVTLFQFFNGSKVNQESVEARLNGGDKKLNWTAGVYGLRIDGNYYEGWQGPSFFTAEEFDNPANPNGCPNPPPAPCVYVPGAWPYGTPPFWNDFVQAPANAGRDAGGIPSTQSPYELLTKSYAAFAQIEYGLSDLVGLTVGARVTSDKKDFQFTWFPYEFFPQSTTGNILRLTRLAGVPLTDYSNSRSDSLFSGKAELDFHLAPDVLTYVSYNRGVKGGGYNAPLFPAFIVDVNGMTFKPETLTSYEVGVKSEFLDRKLRLNGAAYYYDYKDYQALVYVIGLLQQVVNADATHKGAELELEWAPTESWRFGAGVAYVDAIIKNVLGRCCTAAGERISGDFVPGNAPRWTASALARYTFPVGSGRLALQADGNYLSRFWFNLTDLPVVEQPGFGLANVRVNYTPAGGKFEIGVSVENLADKHYGTMGFDNTSINGLAQVYPGMPRWYKAHINYHF